MTSENLSIAARQLEYGESIELFCIDATELGAPEPLYFTNTLVEAGFVQFRGQTYVALDIAADGFESNGKGPFPEPMMRVTNVTRTLVAHVVAYDDLVGARVTRLRTLRKHLDDGSEPDPIAAYKPDVYVVQQKTQQNKTVIEWKLSASVDVQGQQLPRGQVLRGYCRLIYRRYNDTTRTFDYTKATCPYVGQNGSFDNLGNPTDDKNDVANKTLYTCCFPRFGRSRVPFGGFPGAGAMQ